MSVENVKGFIGWNLVWFTHKHTHWLLVSGTHIPGRGLSPALNTLSSSPISYLTPRVFVYRSLGRVKWAWNTTLKEWSAKYSFWLATSQLQRERCGWQHSMGTRVGGGDLSASAAGPKGNATNAANTTADPPPTPQPHRHLKVLQTSSALRPHKLSSQLWNKDSDVLFCFL